MKNILLITFLSFFISSCAFLNISRKTADTDDLSPEDELLLPHKEKALISHENSSPTGDKKTETKRSPASLKVELLNRDSQEKPNGMIVYSPLWIKIPISQCTKIVKNPHYRNGVCLERSQ